MESKQTSPADASSAPLVLRGSWRNFREEPARTQLAERLQRYAREQRWYRSKALLVKSAAIEDVCYFDDSPRFTQCLIVLGLELASGVHESYLLPLAFSSDPAPAADAADTAECNMMQPLIARVEVQAAEPGERSRGALFDATGSRAFADHLRSLFLENRATPSEGGMLRAALFAAAGEAPQLANLEARFQDLEQSNSSIVYGVSWILKLLRKVEIGSNLELEVGRFLASASPPPRVPRPVGALQLSSEAGTRTLAVLSEYVENRGNAWSLTLEALFALFERVLTAELRPQLFPMPGGHPAECREATPGLLVELASPYFGLVPRLAERTAELHRAFGRPSLDPDYGQEPSTSADQDSLSGNARLELARSFAELRERQTSLPGEVQDLAARALAKQAAIDDRLREITRKEPEIARIRGHGDFHLGQVLFTGDDFVIIDFEGEPGRPASERRARCSALRDVAGMLRSFAYAAESALRSERVRSEDRAQLAPWAAAFRAWASVSFVQAYLAGVAGEAYAPRTPADARLLLDFFELEKVIYEVNYELNNRPAWLPLPLRGLLSFQL